MSNKSVSAPAPKSWDAWIAKAKKSLRSIGIFQSNMLMQADALKLSSLALQAPFLETT
ncbi:MAG: hypothetical protein SFW62_07540 [Alphaproteobacteria bacterium]|nr:hypothetical protein [Alphaproteobacteria bacterium]